MATPQPVLITCLITRSVARGVHPHVGAVITSPVTVVTVPPKASALPFHATLPPTVIPAASITVPINVELAPRVVAPVGVQNTSQLDDPLNVTEELATVSSAQSILNIYVPGPSRVIPETPIVAALVAVVQYTPGAYTPIVP